MTARKDSGGLLPWVNALAMPVVTVIVGICVTKAIADREVNARYVELAISILRDQPKEDTKAIRQWAVQIVNEYAAVKLTPEVRKELGEFSFPPLSEEGIRAMKRLSDQWKADGTTQRQR